MTDQVLTNDVIVGLAQQMANLPELQSLTFESNIIKDEDALCALFANLRGYDRLENLNIRENKFSYNVVNALATGIQDKRELRVSVHPPLKEDGDSKSFKTLNKCPFLNYSNFDCLA